MKKVILKFPGGAELWVKATEVSYEVADAAFEGLKSMGIVSKRPDEETYMKNEIYEVWHDNEKIANLIRISFSVEQLKRLFRPPKGSDKFNDKDYWKIAQIDFEFEKTIFEEKADVIDEESVNDYIKSHLDLWHLEHPGR